MGTRRSPLSNFQSEVAHSHNKISFKKNVEIFKNDKKKVSVTCVNWVFNRCSMREMKFGRTRARGWTSQENWVIDATRMYVMNREFRYSEVATLRLSFRGAKLPRTSHFSPSLLSQCRHPHWYRANPWTMTDATVLLQQIHSEPLSAVFPLFPVQDLTWEGTRFASKASSSSDTTCNLIQ